jgi:hypothetical protein
MFFAAPQSQDKKLVTHQALSYYFHEASFKMTITPMTSRDRFLLWQQEK